MGLQIHGTLRCETVLYKTCNFSIGRFAKSQLWRTQVSHSANTCPYASHLGTSMRGWTVSPAGVHLAHARRSHTRLLLLLLC
jgi:hypothetical protein